MPPTGRGNEARYISLVFAALFRAAMRSMRCSSTGCPQPDVATKPDAFRQSFAAVSEPPCIACGALAPGAPNRTWQRSSIPFRQSFAAVSEPPCIACGALAPGDPNRTWQRSSIHFASRSPRFPSWVASAYASRMPLRLGSAFRIAARMYPALLRWPEGATRLRARNAAVDLDKHLYKPRRFSMSAVVAANRSGLCSRLRMPVTP